MRTYRHLRYEKPPLPDRFDGDPRTPPGFLEQFLREFTDPGDVVLNPFAGFVTTLRVATELDREAVGIEYEPAVASYAREQVPAATIHHGHALSFPVAELPAVDCVFTSPPYMVQQDDRNPF